MSNGVAFVRYNAGECVDPYGPYGIGREVVVKLVEPLQADRLVRDFCPTCGERHRRMIGDPRDGPCTTIYKGSRRSCPGRHVA